MANSFVPFNLTAFPEMMTQSRLKKKGFHDFNRNGILIEIPFLFLVGKKEFRFEKGLNCL